MANLSKEDYQVHEERVFQLLAIVRNLISTEGLKGIEHYLNHAEIEMAYELLCLEIIRAEIDLSESVKTDLKDLALGLELDKENVYEPNFWEKLNSFITTHKA